MSQEDVESLEIIKPKEKEPTIIDLKRREKELQVQIKEIDKIIEYKERQEKLKRNNPVQASRFLASFPKSP